MRLLETQARALTDRAASRPEPLLSSPQSRSPLQRLTWGASEHKQRPRHQLGAEGTPRPERPPAQPSPGPVLQQGSLGPDQTPSGSAADGALTGPAPAPFTPPEGLEPDRPLPRPAPSQGAAQVPSARPGPVLHPGPRTQGSPTSAVQWRRFRWAAEVRAFGTTNYKSQKTAGRRRFLPPAASRVECLAAAASPRPGVTGRWLACWSRAWFLRLFSWVRLSPWPQVSSFGAEAATPERTPAADVERGVRVRAALRLRRLRLVVLRRLPAEEGAARGGAAGVSAPSPASSWVSAAAEREVWWRPSERESRRPGGWKQGSRWRPRVRRWLSPACPPCDSGRHRAAGGPGGAAGCGPQSRLASARPSLGGSVSPPGLGGGDPPPLPARLFAEGSRGAALAALAPRAPASPSVPVAGLPGADAPGAGAPHLLTRF
ncbi:collagen alpha-1(I) chain-like [Equus przewalskii]|uniref:Collagen alpha-1(I) chain-like n=1 Tax=Equus przewalskii TaxID=9798 RepID=A0ABM4QGH7_EQUPR